MPLTILQGEALTIPADALLCPFFEKPEVDPYTCSERKDSPTGLTPSADLSAGEVCAQEAPSDLPVHRLIFLKLPPFESASPAVRRQSLRRTLLRALKLADSLGLASVCVSLEAFSEESAVPHETVVTIRGAIRDFLSTSEIDVRLVVESHEHLILPSAFHESLEDYIDETLVSTSPRALQKRRFSSQSLSEDEPDILYDGECLAPTVALPPLEAWIEQIDESFSDTLLHLIAERGLSEVDVYKRANLDRRLFSKIRSKKDYTPKKNTILALCIALELNLDETRDLLSRAGYALSPASVGDIIVEYFILHENYDLFRLNETLFYYDQPLLGG